jgi:hypothetical protein
MQKQTFGVTVSNAAIGWEKVPIHNHHLKESILPPKKEIDARGYKSCVTMPSFSLIRSTLGLFFSSDSWERLGWLRRSFSQQIKEHLVYLCIPII